MASWVRCRSCERTVQRHSTKRILSACTQCGGILGIVDSKVDRRAEKAKRELEELKDADAAR